MYLSPNSVIKKEKEKEQEMGITFSFHFGWASLKNNPAGKQLHWFWFKNANLQV